MADEELLEGLDDYVDPAETEQEETAGKKRRSPRFLRRCASMQFSRHAFESRTSTRDWRRRFRTSE